MRQFRHARSTSAAVAVVTAAALITSSTGAVAKSQRPDRSGGIQTSKELRKAVTVRGIGQHLDALQAVADDNDGTRASGTRGYKDSRDYVVRKLRAAGYKPTVQSFEFPYFAEDEDSVLERTSPTPKTYADPADFATMTFSGSGDTTAPVVAVNTDLSPSATSASGCDPADFASFPDGAIALMQRGSCAFAVKAANAEAAGASAAVVFNRGVSVDNDDGTGTLQGTLGAPTADNPLVGIPVLGTSFAVGQELGGAGTEAHVSTRTTNETRTTYNVIAETKRGNPDNVVMTGAHLDSVLAGPGINDNGSGSAMILEIAEQMAKVKKPANKVRFAWWGAEELDLLGSDHYVSDLLDSNPEALGDIALYLNFDMVASPNFARFVYDGDGSLGDPATDAGPEGSAQIEKVFSRYFARQGLASGETAFDGRSDYGPFIAQDIPAGGLFTGAEGLKTADEAEAYGGTAGEPYDPCYHQACDTRENIDKVALDQMSDAAAHALFVLARSTRAVNGQGSGHHQPKAGKQLARSAAAQHEGHRVRR